MTFMDRIKGRMSEPVVQSETGRVIAVPVQEEDAAPMLDQRTIQRTRHCPHTLNDIQRRALGSLKHRRRLFAPIGVGHGKSWIAVLAGAALDAHLSVILAPASTLDTLNDVVRLLWHHFKIPRTVILSYSRLSQPRDGCMLEEICKDYDPSKVVLICDEAHRIKRMDSARTKRIVRFMQKHPEVVFAPLSGTMTSKSVMDFAHLAELALRDDTPLPRDKHDLESWSQVLDVKGRPNQGDWERFKALLRWGADQNVDKSGSRVDQARRVFQRRLRTTPGVIASKAGSLGVSLLIQGVQDVRIPESIHEALARVEAGEDPGGEVLVDDVSTWRARQHVAQGFYYQWDWPEGTPDTPWVNARSTWFRHVRAELKEGADAGYDSPLLVHRAIARQVDKGGRAPIHQAWRQWEGQRHKKPPPVKTIWIDDYLIRHAAQWACAQPEPVILWYSARAVGDLLRSWGWPVYSAGENPPQAAHTCAMSIKAHGVGKNLQEWRRSLIIAPPSGGLIWEQLLGRSHRQGQRADEVEALVYAHCDTFQDNLRKAIDDARYIEASTGNAQKLLYAVRSHLT